VLEVAVCLSASMRLNLRAAVAILAASAALLGVCAPSHAETIPATVTNQLPQRNFTTYGYDVIGAPDPQRACVSIFTAFYGNAYSGVTFRGITAPRTVECQAAFYYGGPTSAKVSFQHVWSCPGATGWQDVDVPVANCPTYSCPPNQNWTLSGSVCTRPDFPPLGCASGEGGFFVCLGNSPPSGTPSGPGQNTGGGGSDPAPGPGPGEGGNEGGAAGWGGGWSGGGGTLGNGSNTCKKPEQVGDPILASTGNVFHSEADYEGPGPRFVRSYNSATPSWVHNFMVRVIANSTKADVIRPDGQILTFIGSGAGTWASNSTVVGRLEKLSAASSGAAWRYTTEDDAVELYDAAGLPVSITSRQGWALAFQTANSRVRAVTDRWGRSLALQYDGQGRVSGITAPDGQQVSYGYDSQGRLAMVTYGDGATRRYVYENAAYPLHLSGVIDEAGNRFVTWTYDSQGRAVESAQATGALRVQLAYDATGATTVVTDALGRQRNLNFATIQGKKVFQGQDAPCTNCYGDAASKLVDPTTGLVTQSTDFLGVATLFTWDNARKLPLAVTRAAGRPEEQGRTTEWHATFRLPVLVTEAGRTTAYTYDGSGNKISETITDTATGQARTWQWSYNDKGLVETMTEPKGGIWRYGYDAAGNRTSTQNPLGQQTSFSYGTAGRVLSQTEPNGLVTTYSYDARGRLTAQNRGGEVSSFSYLPTGQLASASLPNGVQVSYSYDAAQRLVGASDGRGNSVSHVVDGLGNRLREEVKDANGNIALVTSRVINSLNKVAAIQGSAGQTTQLAYDANGEPVSSTDPLNQTTRQTLDGLRRPVATTFADNTSARQDWNALDQLTRTTDPKGVQTSYQTNAFGEVMSETSPDAGTTSYQRDANGAVASVTDAKGNTGTITRDALGRPTRISYADGAQDFGYDAAGNVTEVADTSGTTVYARDALGRITGKTQSVNDNPPNPTRLNVGYTWQSGDLTGVTYPSGLNIFYRRTAGRITGIDAQEPGGTASQPKPIVPFVANLTHTALAQPKAWSWVNGDTASRTFDADGRMTGNEFASYTWDAANRVTAITQNLWASRSANQSARTASELYTTPLQWTAAYDARNRIVNFSRPGSETGYTYDPNSNRLSGFDRKTSDTDLDGDFDDVDLIKSTTQSLNIDAASNRLLGFAQTQTTTKNGRTRNAVNAPVNYSVDANGAMTSDGLREFEYDATGRLSKVRIFKDGEGASIKYLTNALGQRVFKSEPQVDRTLPSEEELGVDFISWLKKGFGWLFTQTQTNTTSIGTVYVYGDGPLPTWALLGEYDRLGVWQGQDGVHLAAHRGRQRDPCRHVPER
jgi:YD repeat-containing protein